ncbi:hypothetical protein SRB5_58580 [Streptomyces sp. RB5]|uniref:Lipoprotein n=1 Tax=Streptomyces smaragdinus TaxID=2585196 RepID=A0A7K0CQA7_9ACTN|nr:DUF4247 domain-containing protein [Streptomyces smaragdinus]MQY15670.1 hypothetical protein [Streptomyces smaragdinus]
MISARLLRGAVAAATAAVLLTACSSDNGAAVPRDWIGDTYDAGGLGWIDRDSSPAQVAAAIDDKSSALDRTTGGGMELMRYSDDMVTVSPYQGGGSQIEIDDYRNGYHRHQSYVGGIWPDPDSESFRGGGPGEGK